MMNFFDSSASKTVDAVGNAIDKVFTSDEERLKAKAILTKIKQHPAELQVELNKIEAAHRSIFVAGWRPFIGWICGVGLSIPFIVSPIMQWLQFEAVPVLHLEQLTTLVVSLLGLGAMRTFEKHFGRAK